MTGLVPVFVVNPKASNGRCGRIWRRRIVPWLRREGHEYEVRRTESGGHAIELAQALSRENRAIISVGGDGTHNEVVTGLLRAAPDGGGSAPVGFLTLGTGGDFRKTLQLPPDPLAQLEHILLDLASGRSRRLDLGRIRYTAHDGSETERGFLNIASFGLGGEVDDRVNRTTKMLGGFASFLIGTMRATLAYRNRTVRIRLDGRDLGEHTVMNVAVANGRFFGGGMHIAPTARPDDGLFDVVILGDFRLLESLRLAPKLYEGAHLEHAKSEIHRGRKVEAESDEEVLLDVDGEAPGRLPAVFEVVPEAIRVVGVRLSPE